MKYNKGNTLVVLLVIVILALGAWWLYSNSQSSESSGEEQTSGTKGKVYFSITDAAADMGNVTAIDMTVSKLEMHSATEGWVSVSTDSKTFSLLELKAKGESKLAAAIDAPAGTYDQVRVNVDTVVVTTKDGKTSNAKVPSGELKMMSNIVVKADSSSSVSLDFLADASLHTTGNGTYIFAPVVKIDSRSEASVELSGSDVVVVSGGNVQSSGTFGMDLNGDVKSDFKLDSKLKIDLDAKGLIQVPGGPTGTSNEQNSASINAGAKIEIQ